LEDVLSPSLSPEDSLRLRRTLETLDLKDPSSDTIFKSNSDTSIDTAKPHSRKSSLTLRRPLMLDHDSWSADHIINRLYIGDYNSAQSKEELINHKITHIISLGDYKPTFPEVKTRIRMQCIVNVFCSHLSTLQLMHWTVKTTI
jgi:hypothetical protein